MENKVNKKIIISIFAFVILLSLTIFLIINARKKAEIPEFESIVDIESIIESESESKTEIPKPQHINNLPAYRDYYGNNNIVANLIISSLDINLLITRYTDNSYYLKHDVRNNYSQLGNPFFDYRNTNVNSDRQVNIYGHNTRIKRNIDSFPFKKLERFKEKEFYDNNKTVILDTDTEMINYEVEAVKIIQKKDDEHMVLYSSDENAWKSHLDKLLSGSLYNSGKINYDSQILILQACNYEPDHTFLLIICRRIN